jgi:hypothetical protein
MAAMRLSAATLALFALAAALASCGKGQRTATRTVTAQAATPRTAAPSEGGGGSGQLSSARAAAFARAVNLQAADVPGFRASPKEERSSPTEKRRELEVQRCMGGVSEQETLGELGSPNFKRSATLAEQTVSSGVTVERSSAIAKRELDALRSARGSSCFAHFLEQTFKGQGQSGTGIGPISIRRGIPPAQGTAGGFGWRVSASVVVHSVRIPFYMDILGFVYGPAEVTLFSTGLPAPFPAAAEQHLYMLLLSRAKAQHL